MKLRNKKTGKIVDLSVGFVKDTYDGDFIEIRPAAISKESYLYGSLVELNEEWEDYEPTEPLIKNEKIRKAVRAWAEACRLTHATYKMALNEFYDADTRGKFAIKFTLIPIEVYLEDGESYTIAELCGEEDE